MRDRRILVSFVLLTAATFAIVALASALDSAIPLFFAWLPAAVMMRIEARRHPL